MTVCSKCSVDLTDSAHSLKCADCKGFFHPECTRIESYDSFKKLSVRKRSTWKCDVCGSETASTASHDSRGESEPTMSMLMEAFQGLGKNLESQIAEVKAGVGGVQKELEEVKNTIGTVQTTLNTLVAENEERKAEYAKLVQDNGEMREEISQLQQQVRELEQYSRRENVEIVGVPSTRGEDIYCVLDRLAKVLKLNFSGSSLSVAHRLPLRQGQAHPPIIARFVCREDKTAWVRAARENRAKLTAATLSDTWPSTPVYVNDHLTPHYKMILGRAKRLVRERKLAFAWSKDCKVFARKTNSPDCPATLLRTMEDLDTLIK